VAFLAGRGLSRRRACVLVGLSRSGLSYQPRQTDEAELAACILDLAYKHRRYGYRRIWYLLNRQRRKQGQKPVNRKRVHRLWKKLKLSLPSRRKRKRRGQGGSVPCRAEYPNHVWTYDFVFDFCENGRKLKFLTLIDEFTRQALAIEVNVRMSSRQVIEVLERVMAQHGHPAYLRSDNGPEFIARRLKSYLAERGAQTRYIDPGSPWQNAYCESFNGKLRDEFLNQEVFYSPAHAQVLAETWRRYYNTQRPHSSLGYLTPAEFAAKVA
jgi:putative transposase